MRKAFLSRVLVLAIAMTTLISNAAYADTSREYQLKSAYILNFARFIYWPSGSFLSSTDEFNICVYGESPFGESLDYLLGKKVQSRSIEISYKEAMNNLEECHILFVSKSEHGNYEGMLSRVPQSVLTVSDIEGFSSEGGMIEFVRVDNKVKFAINVTQSTKSGIKYKSQLLEVAELLR